DHVMADRLDMTTAQGRQVETGRRRAFIVMAAEGPPSTPFADFSIARRGWRACARHDGKATTSRPNLPAVCCNAPISEFLIHANAGLRRQRRWTTVNHSQIS